MKTKTIEITVTGSTQTGKSAILREIKEHLEALNLAVVFSDRAHRHNHPPTFRQSEPHELPKLDNTVVVLNESNESG